MASDAAQKKFCALFLCTYMLYMLYISVKKKFRLATDTMTIVMEDSGAQIDDDDELTAVCAARCSLMYLIDGEQWNVATELPPEVCLVLTKFCPL
jgi:hypothetical protein